MDAMTKFALAIGKIKQDIRNGDVNEDHADELGGAFEEFVGSLNDANAKSAESAAIRLLSAGQVMYGEIEEASQGTEAWEIAVDFAEKKLRIVDLKAA